MISVSSVKFAKVAYDFANNDVANDEIKKEKYERFK